MKKVFIKLENIPVNNGQVYGEIWLPVHEIHSMGRIKNELLISFTDIVRSSLEGGGIAVYSYICETEEIALNTITRIFDAMVEAQS